MAMPGVDNSQDDSAVMSEINMTPLVDVMLVLLIIFIVTIPVINDAVRIQLPRASNVHNDVKPEHVNVAIDATGRVYWNGRALSEDGLTAKLAAAAAREPKPELHLRADRQTPYAKVARVMAASQRAGIGRISFVTEPEP
ncbi:MAG: biopolymer transporter ExbD [Zoogloea sp.]|nr:biopolymer transporter ExbD [Zoogloea sp.]